MAKGKQSESYKQFVNINGVSVFERAAFHITDKVNMESKAETFLTIQATIRTMEEMFVIADHEAEKLIDLLIAKACGK